MNLKAISDGIWHDYEHNVSLIYSPDDKGYYWEHANNKTSQVFNTIEKAVQDFTDGFINWND